MNQPASDIQVSVFARTDTGMRRPANEDAFLVADLTTGRAGLGPDVTTHRIGERGSLMVVSDGMGGAAAGEIASEMAVKAVREALMDLPPGLDPCDRLKHATETANERIWNYASRNPHLAGMGATLTGVLVNRALAYIAQVGDSRAYLIRGSRIKQLTRDQSLAQLLVDSGAIEPDQAASVPQNVIMQALGTSPTVEVAMAVVELCRNDHLVLCSDGLSNKVTAEEIREMVERSESLTAACRSLIEIANARGGEDNITVIAARFDGDALHSAGESNSITGSFRIVSQGCFDRDLSASSGEYAAAAEAAPPAEEVTTLVFNSLPLGISAPETLKQTPEPDVAKAPAAASRRSYVVYAIGALILLMLVAVVLYVVFGGR